MTLEEAIKTFEEILQLSPTLDETGCSVTEAMKVALSALRPVSREKVEKVWRGEWVGVPNMGVYDTACSKCGYCPGIRFWDSDFCPNCGAPMTDEAVEIVMRRLEELHDTSN